MRGIYSAIAALVVWSSPPLTASASAPAVTAAPKLESHGPFVFDEKLEKRVLFWVDIYAKFHSWETAVHDVKFPQIVYSSVDTRKKSLGQEKLRVLQVLQHMVAKWKKIQAGILTKDKLSAEEAKYLSMFEASGLETRISEFVDLKRIRGQAGLRDNLESALFMSGRYLPRMEKVFERFDLPTEIAYLPFVESGFNKKAVSKVGASGIWQFMPYTGKLYLRVDSEVDERNDPMRAAEAAARLLRQNYEFLDEWPLAITAYNHGSVGIAKAAKETGTKVLAEIIEKFESKTFGFASQNFYCSFLAAIHVAKNSNYYLGEIPRAKKLEFDEFVMPNYMELQIFLKEMEIDPGDFRELNPALTEEVMSGRKFMPVGYTVRVPVEARRDFLSKYEKISPFLKHARQKGEEKRNDSSSRLSINDHKIE